MGCTSRPACSGSSKHRSCAVDVLTARMCIKTSIVEYNVLLVHSKVVTQHWVEFLVSYQPLRYELNAFPSEPLNCFGFASIGKTYEYANLSISRFRWPKVFVDCTVLLILLHIHTVNIF